MWSDCDPKEEAEQMLQPLWAMLQFGFIPNALRSVHLQQIHHHV